MTARIRNRGGRPSKHGARALARHLAGGTLDGRTWIAKALKDIRDELAGDAGGLDHLSARERVLVDRCAAQAVICMSLEHFVLTHDPITPDGVLLPVLAKGYTSHVQSLSRMLQALGLRPDRVSEPSPIPCGACGQTYTTLPHKCPADAAARSAAVEASAVSADAASEPTLSEEPTP